MVETLSFKLESLQLKPLKLQPKPCKTLEFCSIILTFQSFTTFFMYSLLTLNVLERTWQLDKKIKTSGEYSLWLREEICTLHGSSRVSCIFEKSLSTHRVCVCEWCGKTHLYTHTVTPCTWCNLTNVYQWVNLVETNNAGVFCVCECACAELNFLGRHQPYCSF